MEKYFDKVFEKVYNHVQPSNEPTAIYIAGQPGAGKSKVVEDVLEKQKQNAVVIDTDHLRTFHPQYRKVMKESPELAYDLLDTLSFKAITKIVDRAIAEKKSIIFDGTFGGGKEHILNSLEKMKEANFKTELVALASNHVVSTIGITFRKEDQEKKNGFGRTVDADYHNTCFTNINKNIQLTFDKNLFDKATLHKRNYIKRTSEIVREYTPKEFNDFQKDFSTERDRRLTKQEYAITMQFKEKTEKLIIERTNHKSEDLKAFRKDFNHSYKRTFKKDFVPDKKKGMKM
jgi:predicted ABC-type ATPase